jgi:signal transduction histidine kinase
MLRAASDRVREVRPSADAPGTSVVKGAVLRFVAFSLLAALVLTGLTILVSERIAQRHALIDARQQAAGIADRVAAPLVDEDVRGGVPGASDALTQVMQNRMADGSLSRVKIWDADGRIIWSDEDELIGRRFELEDDVRRLFGTHETTAELSDLSREENVAERSEESLLEVYAGTVDAQGAPLVFEAYLDLASMQQTARSIMVSFVPVVIGSFVLFVLVVVPLAVKLGRRVEKAQRDRARMMRHVVIATELERRRIAEDLHDGVVQELAGLGYTLPTATRQLEEGGDTAVVRTILKRAEELIQRNVTALRSLMTDIYPPDVHGPGLRDAVRDLVHTEAGRAGITASTHIQDDLDLPVEAGRLTYRIVREALRNVAKHAQAGHVSVDLHCYDGHVDIRVVDDGRGPGPNAGRGREGHLGLRLLRDSMDDLGGSMDISAGPDGGTALTVTFPAAFEHP